LAYDVQPSNGFDRGENTFYITLQGEDEQEIRAGWGALSDGAEAIRIPLGPAPFAPLYGMLTRFGVTGSSASWESPDGNGVRPTMWAGTRTGFGETSNPRSPFCGALAPDLSFCAV
jgi:hypothetical protein